MIVKLLTEHHLEFLSIKGGCRSSSESTLVKISNCWKSHAAAQFSYFLTKSFLMRTSKIHLSLAKTAYLTALAKFSSLVCEKSDVRNPKTFFSSQAALTKVMSTCPQIILVQPFCAC